MVYATGFYSNPFLKEIAVTGEDGQSLRSHWQSGARAYHGIMTTGFPNLFILYGPNTNSGHTSIIFKLEQQVGYVLQLMDKAGAGHIAVNSAAEAEYDAEMQRRLGALNWDKVEQSWYKDGARITNNWPGSTREYKRRMKQPIWEDFEVNA